MEKMYLNASEVSRIMGISKSAAYKVIKNLNDQLKDSGYYTIAGKVSKRYFDEKCYGYGGCSMNE